MKKMKEVTINGETKTVREWADVVGVNERTIYQRLRQNLSGEELLRPKGVWKPTSKFNEHYFDTIDDEHKAYWLGFIWADGYLGIRNRSNRQTEYNLKLSLNEDDYKHLEKFNKDIDGSYEVHYYDMSKTGFKTDKKEARLFITNQYFGKLLSEKYGLIPRRIDCDKVLAAIPDDLMKHFLRGIFDADGSFTHYHINNKETINKYVVQFSSNTAIVEFAQKYFIANNIIYDVNRKLYKRHEDRDGDYITLVITGKTQVVNVLNFLYRDTTVYLDRKYEKYQQILLQANGLKEGVNIHEKVYQCA